MGKDGYICNVRELPTMASDDIALDSLAMQVNKGEVHMDIGYMNGLGFRVQVCCWLAWSATIKHLFRAEVAIAPMREIPNSKERGVSRKIYTSVFF